MSQQNKSTEQIVMESLPRVKHKSNFIDFEE